MNDEISNQQNEFGCSSPIKFANATLYDSKGNIVLCPCGNPCETAIIGKEAYAAYCEKCSPIPTQEVKIIYRDNIGRASRRIRKELDETGLFKEKFYIPDTMA